MMYDLVVPWNIINYKNNPKIIARNNLEKSKKPGPRGPKPKKIFTRSNILLYGALILFALYFILPLWVMVVTSFKDMAEIRQGNIFALPNDFVFHPWKKAWSEVCTGLDCSGLSKGFLNSVKILVPSVLISVVIASVSGYTLSLWRFKGSDTFFTILMIGVFIPYQVMLFPVVVILRELGVYGSLWGLILVHTIFGMPINTLLFRNHFASVPIEIFKAARVDGAKFWGIFFRIMLPISLPVVVVSTIIQTTGIWNDFLFGVIFTTPKDYPMTVQLNNIVNSVQGVKEYNVNMAATLITGMVPLLVYLFAGKFFVRGIAAGAVKG